MTRDLTQGSPTRLIISFSGPLMLGFLFQQFYNFVDSAIVGRTLGVEALAAVGSTGALNFLILGFCMGVCSGFSIPVAQSYGAGNIPALRRYVINGAILCVGVAAVFTLCTVLLCRAMLVMMNTPENILDMAYTYLVIIFAFTPATIFFNYISGVIRALGDSRTPVIFLIMASVVNILLDFWFIVGLGMGVEGAALATGISQIAAGLGCLWVVIRHVPMLTFHKEDWRAEPQYMKPLLGQGVPMGLQFSITAIGSVIISASVNSLGSNAVAAVTAGGKISMFFCCVFDALGSTMATYAGQNMGAGRIDRIRQGLKSASLIGIGYALIALAVIYFFGRQMVGIFVTGEEKAALESAYRYLVMNALAYVPLVFVNVLRLLIQGVGFTRLAMFAGVSEMAARTLTGLVLVPLMGFNGACLSNPLAWIFASTFLAFATVRVLKKLERRAAAAAVAQ